MHPRDSAETAEWRSNDSWRNEMVMDGGGIDGIVGTMTHPTLVAPPVDRQFPSMTPNRILDEILRLPAEQQLKLVEDVWDRIAASPENVPMPEWHRAELDRRLADPAEQATLSWDDVQGRLKPKP